MTKMITKIWMLIALLMVATAGCAQNTVNLEDSDDKDVLRSKVSFSGTNLTAIAGSNYNKLKCFDAVLSPGQTVNVTCDATAFSFAQKKETTCVIVIALDFFVGEGDQMVHIDGGGIKRIESKSLKFSCKVPANATAGQLMVNCIGHGHKTSCNVNYKIKKGGNTNANKQTSTSKRPSWWKEREPEPISRCDHPLSGISINDLCGEVSVRCNDDEDDSYEFAELDGLIREEDRTRTKEESEVILGLEDMNTYHIRPNSIVVIRTEKNNVSKFEMIVGSIWANIKKMAEGKSMELEMSHCVSGIKGTIVAFEETGKESRVYLFAGKVEVTGKKSKKKTMLKAGQASIVGSDGKIKVKKFDIEKGAKKFGIPMKDIKNHYSNTPTSSSKGSSTKVSSSGTISEKVQKRYAMQRGTIKYKYAKGKQTGEIIRTFDSYGHYERVASKVKGSSATSLNIYRGEKAYKVDTKAKTVTQSKHEAINFLNITEAELSKHKLKKKGTATVAGKQCVVYGNANEDYYVWQGITLKKVINSKDGKIVSEAVSITQPTKIDANKFKVPSNYTLK